MLTLNDTIRKNTTESTSNPLLLVQQSQPDSFSYDHHPPIDEETLARATLTFALDGAHALMTSLLLGSPNAHTVVDTLHQIVTTLNKNKQSDIKPSADDSKTQSMQADLPSLKSNQSNVAEDTIGQLAATKRLDDYLLRGLQVWNAQHATTPALLRTFHRCLKHWCTRLQHLPSWDTQFLRDWFSDHGKEWIIAPHSQFWPHQLQDLAIHNQYAPPLCLWGIGDPQALIQCAHPLAIVGSRGCNDYGRQIAYQLAYQASLKGHTVVSGGAYGIDAAAHLGAIHACDQSMDQYNAGRTIVVFAGGLKRRGPQSNMPLFNQIINHGGACISELCPDTTPIARRFLVRNRIIAALASHVIVAQARLRSGAINTAAWANDLNRELYAVPGNITHPDNAGCNELIQQYHAMIICSAHDVDTIYPHVHHHCLNTQSSKKTSTLQSCNDPNTSDLKIQDNHKQYFSKLQLQIFDAINLCRQQHRPASIDTIYHALCASLQGKHQNLIPSVAEVSGAVATLELQGYIKQEHNIISIARQAQ